MDQNAGRPLMCYQPSRRSRPWIKITPTALLRIKAAQALPGLRLRLTLDEGKIIERDVAPLLKGPVFERIRTDPAEFARVTVEGGTVVWPNGADLCPDDRARIGPVLKSGASSVTFNTTDDRTERMDPRSAPTEPKESEVDEIKRTADLLGGPKVLRRSVRGRLEVHEIIESGLPGAALTYLVGKVGIIRTGAVLDSAGMSLRTFQRHKLKAARKKPLSVDQSARTWQFAETLARATKILGSQEEAEQWMERPAIGLDERRPIDLLKTPVGTKLVDEHLGRMEYGVYA